MAMLLAIETLRVGLIGAAALGTLLLAARLWAPAPRPVPVPVRRRR